MGAMQTRGTCWFYSILNGFILSEEGKKILYVRLKEFYKKLTLNERAYFDDDFNAPCPAKNVIKTKEIYFWKFIDQYLCYLSGPRAASLKAGKSASILGGVSLQSSIARKEQGGVGGRPQEEIDKVLDHLGFAKDYYVTYGSKKFHASRKPQFVILKQSKTDPALLMRSIPDEMRTDSRYELMCASIGIINTKKNYGHAITGYVCNHRGFIYDSNQRKVFKCNWWNYASLKKVVENEISLYYPNFKNGGVDLIAYSYAVFSRKEFTKGIAPVCLMKYKTKPNLRLNYTDPNLLNKINKSLKPAEIIAIKRRWARTEHRKHVYLNQGVYNSIVNSSKNFGNGVRTIRNLTNSGYKIKDPNNYNKFLQKLRNKFTPVKTYTFVEAKAHLNKFKTVAARKKEYALVWKGIPMTKRKVLMHYRNKGEWLANNAFENKVKPPIKRKPQTERATKVRANFNTYWKGLKSNNRKLIRNYINAYKSPSPVKTTPSINAKKSVKK